MMLLLLLNSRTISVPCSASPAGSRICGGWVRWTRNVASTLLSREADLGARQLRLERGWSQEELGHRAGKHWTYIGGIERGERNPTLAVIADLAKALRVRIAELFPE